MSRDKDNKRTRNTNGIGSIREHVVLKNGKEYRSYQGRVTLGRDPGTGKQIQRSIYGKTKKEVTIKMNEAIYDYNQGRNVKPNKMTVKEWMELWQSLYMGDVKPSTAYEYRCNIERYIIPRLGAVKLVDLEALDIQRMYTELHEPEDESVRPLSSKTVRNIHGVLHKALKQAVKLGYLRINPAEGCKPPRVVKKATTYLEESVLQKFLEAIKGHIHELIYLIAVFTGLRESELLGLTWDCVDFAKNEITVRQQLRKDRWKGGGYHLSLTKNSKTRYVTVAPSVMDMFRLQQAKQNAMRREAGDMWVEKNMVFTNALGGYLSYRTVYDCFKRVVTKMGHPELRVHDLRHTYATLSLKGGDDVKTVQNNLGHSSANITMDTYAHATKDMRRDSADRMEKTIQSFLHGDGEEEN